jgi:CCR4-NOT complex subunit CAF16
MTNFSLNPHPSKAVIELNDFEFRFEGAKTLLKGIRFELYPGECALLVGANGCGKSTLLRLLYGLHLTRHPGIKVLGKSPFETLDLVRSVSIIQGELELSLDLTVSEVIQHQALGVFQKELLELLGIDLEWRMHRLSDGERKRVQLFLGLQNEEARLLLLDEVTAHLDVTLRNDLMSWLKVQAQQREVAVLYCTHIFDGLIESSEKAWFDRGLWLGKNERSYSFAYMSVAKTLQSLSLNQLMDRWMRSNQAGVDLNGISCPT